MNKLIIAFLLLLISGCGGSSDPSQAEKTDITILSDVGSVNAFIKSIVVSIDSIDNISTVEFLIASKEGAASKPIHATYTKKYIQDRGFFEQSTGKLNIPVFGLYSNFNNNVNLTFNFSDGSHKAYSKMISTEEYVDSTNIYNNKTIIKSRGQSESLSFDFFFIKSIIGYPVIVDSDGETRWTISGGSNSMATIFENNIFYTGSISSTNITKITLDGVVSTNGSVVLPFTNFHHDLLPGKTGWLAEFDENSSSPVIHESQLVEINSNGDIIKQWYMGSILSQVITAASEDPSNFVREGYDWFHMNSAIYDSRDNSLIISSRENFVMKIDYDTGNLKWILGDTTKHWYVDYPSLRPYALTLINGAREPIGQHALSIDNAGRLMLFNNGRESYNNPTGTAAGQTRTYSMASSYLIDESNMTADEVWSFDNGQQVFSDICSSVFQDEGGDYLLSYAVAENRTKAKLVATNTAGDIIFDFEMPTTACNTSWNARPINLTNIVFN